MTSEELKALMDGIEALRGVVSDGIGNLTKRCDAMAERFAADRRADSLASDVRRLSNEVNALNIHSRMNAATRNQFAELQAKADVAYRGWNESCPPPMSSEGILDYAIRIHRPLQKHSKKFKTTELLA